MKIEGHDRNRLRNGVTYIGGVLSDSSVTGCFVLLSGSRG